MTDRVSVCRGVDACVCVGVWVRAFVCVRGWVKLCECVRACVCNCSHMFSIIWRQEQYRSTDIYSSARFVSEIREPAAHRKHSEQAGVRWEVTVMSFTCSSRGATVKLKSRAISNLLQSATGYLPVTCWKPLYPLIGRKISSFVCVWGTPL